MAGELVGLQPWQKEYAEWAAVQPQIPSKYVKQEKAVLLSGGPVTFKDLHALEASGPFKALHKDLLRDEIEGARLKFQLEASKFASDYIEMAALAKADGNYDKWIKYGLPILERVWAKSEDQKQVNTQVIVNFGTTGFASREIAKVEDAAFEVIVHPERV